MFILDASDGQVNNEQNNLTNTETVEPQIVSQTSDVQQNNQTEQDANYQTSSLSAGETRFIPLNYLTIVMVSWCFSIIFNYFYKKII